MFSSNQESKEKVKNSWDSAFEGFPEEELSRLFIDKPMQEKCKSIDEIKYAFDKQGLNGANGEPGYYNAMMAAFAYMKETLGKKLDAKELQKIRSICIKDVKNLRSSQTEFGASGYALDHQLKVSDFAKKEWLDEKLIFTADMFSSVTKNEYNQFLADGLVQSAYTNLFIRSKFSKNKDETDKSYQERISSIVDAYFKQYYEEITQVKTDEDKLTKIVTLCRKLEISHFFGDANQRTIVFYVLNKLLIENGFKPAILENPIVFDGYHSVKELVQDVMVGMKNFLSHHKKSEKEQTISKNSSLN